MTPCENYWEALNAFVDGECSPEEEAKLRAHLTECEACREALAELTALRGGFPHWEDEEVPEGFADGVLQRIAGTPQQAPKKARRKHRAAWASLAACLGIMVLLGTLFPGNRSASSANTAAPASDAAVTAGQAAEPQSGEAEDSLTASQAAEAGGEDPSKLMMERAKLTQAGADLCWTLTADEEQELLSGFDCQETEEGRVYTLTAGDIESVRAQAEAEGIALPWEDSAVVYTTGAAAPDPTAGGGESSGNSSSSPGSGDPGTYRVLIQPMEEGT